MGQAHAEIRVIIVDDNPDIQDAVKILLNDTDDILLVGQAQDGLSAIKLCKMAKPDLVLMDVVMPGMNGAETTRSLMDILPATKILALSSFHEYEHIQSMLTSGAIGYLVKDGLIQDLVATIRSTMQGNTVLSPSAAQSIFLPHAADKQVDFGLTDRELQVLKRMADGLTYNGIAHDLHITAPTVRFHVNNILEKMNVATRSEVLVLAAKNNLV
jgi:NarL family two-component system response regulator LiaR